MAVKRPFTRDQRTTVLYGMLAFVLMLVVLQPVSYTHLTLPTILRV